MTDPGRSGFRRKNWDTYALAEFVEHVKAGTRVLPGSYLLVENLDRLSREEVGEATELFLSIVNKGVVIVQLSPVVMEFKKPVDMPRIILAIAELQRGNSESAMKSKRLLETWGEKKAQARAARAVLTARAPAWLEVVGRGPVGKHVKGGAFRVIPGRAATLRQIFTLSARGYGLFNLVKHLTDTGVPTWGRGQGWTQAYLHKILSGRAVLGEYQPRDRHGQPDGAPIPGYFPAVIDPDLWESARLARIGRRRQPGRTGARVASLFTGLIRDARTRTTMVVSWQDSGGGGGRSRRSRRRTLRAL